ncbi:16S rRNA (cytosine(1402)-N(4))-methyltransferase RsmH [bacterium]|nr:16S rRNA (cytosine(1402)-N(4))-methyltransferase RsmH [bacterium]
MQNFTHYTVMKNEAVDALECADGKIYVDCTLGGGGHSELILQRISPSGQLIAFDIDQDAIDAASERLKNYKNLTIVKSSYTNIKKVISDLGIKKITGGVLFDLGASYHQLTKQERGFSFSKEAPLDMRFNQDEKLTAYDVINKYSENDLVRIFSEYGEEHFSKRIAKEIVNKRKVTNIKTTTELANLIVGCTPHVKSKVHPATRVFQAIRIEVNHELQNVKSTLNDLLDILGFGAIISIISFHSLEDRIVKHLFKYHSTRCHCDKTQAICNCPPPILELVNKKPITATEKEIIENPPSRSAKLRVARYIKK